VVERAYVAGVLTRAGSLAQLVKLDFTPEASETILQTVEAENPVVFAPESVQALRVPSATALTEALRAGIIDDLIYYARMTEGGYDRATADMYLNLAIRSERKKEKTLTPAQVLEAYSRDFFNRAQAMSRLTSLGYNEADATLLLRFEKSGIEDTEPWKLLLSGALAPEDAFAQLSGLGFTMKEIEAALAALEG
jgi:Holliday junction resolvasome RuvABC DNA-binding subunit